MDPITQEKIDELLQFLPAFQVEGRTFIEWQGGEERAEGAIHIHYPRYPQDVEEFFRLAAQPCWCDYGYKPGEASDMLADDRSIESASLAEIKTMLTYCVRGERFCDGHWGAMLESGKIVKILERLRTLRKGI